MRLVQDHDIIIKTLKCLENCYKIISKEGLSGQGIALSFRTPMSVVLMIVLFEPYDS